MIHAGANAGVYGLREMAFESVEGFLRAGTFAVVLEIRDMCKFETDFSDLFPYLSLLIH